MIFWHNKKKVSRPFLFATMGRLSNKNTNNLKIMDIYMSFLSPLKKKRRLHRFMYFRSLAVHQFFFRLLLFWMESNKKKFLPKKEDRFLPKKEEN